MPTSFQSSRLSARGISERLLIVVFGCLLVLPLFQQSTGIPEDKPLQGSEVRLVQPVFTWENWFSGGFAPRFERWLTTHIGCRGFLVRLACQLNYSLFGKTGMRGGTEITLGRDHWLFESAYVKAAVRQPEMGRTKAIRFAEQADAVRQALNRRGIAFLVVISPSKAEVMPEYLPSSVTLPPRANVTGYARVTEALRARGVPFLDGRQLFLDLKQAGERELFPPTGTHWSHYGAWLAWQKAARLLNGQAPGVDLPPQPIERIVRNPPLGADDDLRQLLNLWRFDPREPRDLPYPIVAPPPAQYRDRYSALVAGDSFSLTLVDAMARSGQFLQIDLLYYFKRRITYPTPAFPQASGRLIADDGLNMGAIDPADPGWELLLSNRRIVILAINEIHMKDAGWGFMESLLAALD